MAYDVALTANRIDVTLTATVVAGGGGGSGTVTSVALTAPAALFTVTGSPVTTTGTLALTFPSWSARQVLIGPTGSGANATPTVRALELTDLPSLAARAVLGNAGAFAGFAAEITAGSTFTVLSRGSGTTIAFNSLTSSYVSDFTAAVDARIAAAGSASAGNTLFVSTLGNNSTAAEGNVNLPWLTIEAAVAAAGAGDTVHVFGGSYAPAGAVVKSGVDVVCADNVTVTLSGSNTINDASGAVTEFTWTGGTITAAGTVVPVALTNGASSFRLAPDLISQTGTGDAVTVTAASLTLSARSVTAAGASAYALNVTTGTVAVEGTALQGGGLPAIRHAGGTTTITGGRIDGQVAVAGNGLTLAWLDVNNGGSNSITGSGTVTVRGQITANNAATGVTLAYEPVTYQNQGSHASLSDLSYAAAGHTGFAGTGVDNTFSTGGTTVQTVTSTGTAGNDTLLVVDGANTGSASVRLSLRRGTTERGYLQVTSANLFEIGNAVTYLNFNSAVGGLVNTSISTWNYTATSIIDNYAGTSGSQFFRPLTTGGGATNRSAGAFTNAWATSTEGSQLGRFTFSVYGMNGGVATAYEIIRLEGLSSNAGALSFFGATAQAKQTISTPRYNGKGFRDLLAALAGHGLVTDSSVAGVATKTTTYSVADTDGLLNLDATSAGFTTTLPTAVGRDGQLFAFRKHDATTNTATIATTSSQTINGAATWALNGYGSLVVVQSDGSNWVVVRRFEALIGGGLYVAAPTNTTIVLDSSARFPYTVEGVHNLKTGSGTLTLALQINGTNVTGLSALAVTSTPQSPNASAANAVAVGDRVTCVVSSVSSPTDLEFSVRRRR